MSLGDVPATLLRRPFGQTMSDDCSMCALRRTSIRCLLGSGFLTPSYGIGGLRATCGLLLLVSGGPLCGAGDLLRHHVGLLRRRGLLCGDGGLCLRRLVRVGDLLLAAGGEFERQTCATTPLALTFP